jgi:hypothetical protein
VRHAIDSEDSSAIKLADELRWRLQAGLLDV